MKFERSLCAIALVTTMAGCAGLNPNPGERTTDIAWTSGNYARAVEFAKPAAEAGKPWAQLRMGIFYKNGWGTEESIEKAEYWYKKAAAQKADGKWAEGQTIGTVGENGYFNQNSDARIAQFNLAQLYYETDKNLPEARNLIDNVIQESKGGPIFFCCEFSGGRYFGQSQFVDLKKKIENRIAEKDQNAFKR